MSTDDYADLARHAEAIPPEARDWTYQSWGEQNQNGDHADSILYDGRGETIVYELPNDVGEFIAAANPATILRLIEDNRRMRHGSLCPECNAKAWGERADFRRERDELAARLAAVEALADEWERRAQLAESTADARALEQAADTLGTRGRMSPQALRDRANDLRAGEPW